MSASGQPTKIMIVGNISASQSDSNSVSEKEDITPQMGINIKSAE